MTGNLPLNALRAFEAAARHLSFTRAADELCVTQAAVSHQVKALEARLGTRLFRRAPRGLVLTDEGLAVFPTVNDAFSRLARLIDRFEGPRNREVLTLSVVGTFAVGWLLERLPLFREAHPFVDLRLLTNNNKVDLAAEGLDFAIRFGDGSWQGAWAEQILPAGLSVVCSPELAARLKHPRDLEAVPLLRPYRPQDWIGWAEAAGVPDLAIRGPIFDSTWVMVQAALRGEGAALAPPAMFQGDLQSGRLVQPFPIEVRTGAYWLTRLHSRAETEAMRAFREWALRSASGA